ncbi:Pathogenicity locus [Andreprevotia lacus DSM 23236]|jgi:hypothetical protein|uniref:Pathogenicity locus n=1 Tax=Andreprevotia lacus DSM 23236 TaxID=1121001 RepID=A0A1W1XAK1_9NEIS|nr:helix-hairpin-helix domain-containing protein [Andreprevotia lacus]SMC20889.1 Pathogenicity locus [Andreprevotia lacus DSM 23236]
MPKAQTRDQVRQLQDLPNIGKAMAADLQLLGITQPAQLVGQDAFALHLRLCVATGAQHDPCVIDTFMAAIDFMQGAPARPWWDYTAERKRLQAARKV